MGNSVTFTKAKVFKTGYPKDNPTFYKYHVGISNKNKDGSYENCYLSVEFPRNTPEVPNGTFIDADGFLTCRTWISKVDHEKHNELIFRVMNFSYHDEDVPKKTVDDFADNFEAAEEEIPF